MSIISNKFRTFSSHPSDPALPGHLKVNCPKGIPQGALHRPIPGRSGSIHLDLPLVTAAVGTGTCNAGKGFIIGRITKFHRISSNRNQYTMPWGGKSIVGGCRNCRLRRCPTSVISGSEEPLMTAEGELPQRGKRGHPGVSPRGEKPLSSLLP